MMAFSHGNPTLSSMSITFDVFGLKALDMALNIPNPNAITKAKVATKTAAIAIEFLALLYRHAKNNPKIAKHASIPRNCKYPGSRSITTITECGMWSPAFEPLANIARFLCKSSHDRTTIFHSTGYIQKGW